MQNYYFTHKPPWSPRAVFAVYLHYVILYAHTIQCIIIHQILYTDNFISMHLHSAKSSQTCEQVIYLLQYIIIRSTLCI